MSTERQRNRDARVQDWHEMVMPQRFSAALAPWVGREVGVWLTRPDRPYVGGELLRVVDVGLVVAGKGVVAHWEIDRVGCDGREVRYADFL